MPSLKSGELQFIMFLCAAAGKSKMVVQIQPPATGKCKTPPPLGGDDLGGRTVGG
jgi:hypothetical protein